MSHYLQWADKGKPGWLRYLVGALLVLLISLFFGQIFSVVGAVLIASQSAAATIVKTTFFGFIVSFVLVPLVPRALNSRPWWSIAMPALSIRWWDLLTGAGIAVATMAVLNAIGWLIAPEAYTYAGIDPSSWLPMLAIAAVAFFVQASTEEMVYRGYLAQSVWAFTRSPLLALVVPALIFSAPHLGNVAGSTGLAGLAPYMIVGLTYGWIAYRSGSLWMSTGVHAANNWFITMFVGSAAEKIAKVSMFTTHGTSSNGELIAGIAIQNLVVVGLTEAALRGRISRPEASLGRQGVRI